MDEFTPRVLQTTHALRASSKYRDFVSTLLEKQRIQVGAARRGSACVAWARRAATRLSGCGWECGCECGGGCDSRFSIDGVNEE